MREQTFVVATPGRSVCDNEARVLAEQGLLRGYFLGEISGNPDIPRDLTRLCYPFALWTKATWHIAGIEQWEWLRSAAHPAFDAWVRSLLRPGDNVISSYGYCNLSFQYARNTGGKTFIDAGNSHPAQFWEIVSEEHRKWRVDRWPMPPHWNKRGRRMLDFTDYVLSPSSYVTKSFTSRGWPSDRIFYLPYPVDLSVFSFGSAQKAASLRSKPLRVICTGSVSVRKGFPYLLEAMRIIRREREAMLMLTDVVESSMRDILPLYNDIPIEWAPSLPHDKLAQRLHSADVFALLSLEEGLARTVTEALACGLPAVVSCNTGSSDFVLSGINGEVVPVCDAPAAAEAILKCALRPRPTPETARALLEDLSFASFRRRFCEILNKIGVGAI